MGGSDRTSERLVDEVCFPAISGSWALTKQIPVVDGTAVSAFSWVFVIQWKSRWAVDRVIPGVWRDSPLSVVQDAEVDDVDLVVVAAGGFSATDVEDSLDTILGMFQRPDRCSPLNEQLPRGRSVQEEGLQRLLCWGVKPVATLGSTSPYLSPRTVSQLQRYDHWAGNLSRRVRGCAHDSWGMSCGCGAFYQLSCEW